MRYTAHSETGRIKSIFIKPAEKAFISDLHIGQYWRGLNYLDRPDFNRACSEYLGFRELLGKKDAEIYEFPEDPSVNMDSIYCRDAAISTNRGMILCNMGKEMRKAEPAAQKRVFEARGIPILGSILDPGTLEGGDTAWLDENTLAVGHTYRTNPEGIRQLKTLLSPLNVDVITVDLPHYKGPSDVFHLMSIFSPVDEKIAVVFSPLMPIPFRALLLDLGFLLVEVPESEFDSMGCNVLALAPRECLMAEGNPLTKRGLENAGCTVLGYKGDEISVKGGGGPTCLTRPIFRYA